MRSPEGKATLSDASVRDQLSRSSATPVTPEHEPWLLELIHEFVDQQGLGKEQRQHIQLLKRRLETGERKRRLLTSFTGSCFGSDTEKRF